MKRIVTACISLFVFFGLLFISAKSNAVDDASGKCNMGCTCNDWEQMICNKDHGEYTDENNNKVICTSINIEGSSVITLQRPDFLEEPSIIFCKKE